MSLKLLVVEDDILLAEVISDYFTSKEWQVEVVTDGETALELVEERSFQLILLDVMLPKQNGFMVCRKIREKSWFIWKIL